MAVVTGLRSSQDTPFDTQEGHLVTTRNRVKRGPRKAELLCSVSPPPRQSGDPNQPVVLTEAGSSFQAETVAAALQARGIPAKVVDHSTADTLSQYVVRPKVMVRRVDVEQARETLKTIRSEAGAIDWDEVDVGTSDDADRMLNAGRLSRRSQWTMVLTLLVPLGAIMVYIGGLRSDPFITGIGYACLGTALVSVLWLNVTRPKMPPSDPGEPRV
jgi:hypothetical protein